MSAHTNPLDNSETLQSVSQKDEYLLSRTGQESELDSMIKYMKYLELRASLNSGTKTIKVDGKDINVAEMLPQNTEFDNYREKVIVMLNRLTSDHPLFQQLARDFGTNSVFELSGKIANFYLGETRAERITALIDGKHDGKDVFEALAGLSETDPTKRKAAREAALTALADGKVTRTIKGSRVR